MPPRNSASRMPEEIEIPPTIAEVEIPFSTRGNLHFVYPIRTAVATIERELIAAAEALARRGALGDLVVTIREK